MTTTTKKSVLITGANKGIGFETARQLTQQGFTVWMGARDQARGQAAVAQLVDDGDVRLVVLDVTDATSVDAAVDQIGNDGGSLDVLINNAGVAIGAREGLAGAIDPEVVRETFDANVYGALRVTQAFLPLVRRSPAGRIVNVSSTMGSLATVVAPGNPLGPPWAFAYPVSKTVLNALTAWLAVELNDTPIKVNSVCPGFNATDMNNHQGTQHPSEGAKVVVRAATLASDGPTGTFFDVNGAVAW